jgi:uncharacterized protein
MKIDAHVHLNMSNGKGWAHNAKALVYELDKAGIEKAFLLPDGIATSNDCILRSCERYPGRFFGFGMVDPSRSRKAIAAAVRSLRKKKCFKGLKLHPRTQGFTLDHKNLSYVLEEASRYRAPVVIDCFPYGKGNYLDLRNYPIAFDRIAKNHPDVKIVMAHMGGNRVLDALVVAKSNNNIYLETSFTLSYFKGSSVEQDIAFIIRKLGSHRILYGSDYSSFGIAESLESFARFCKKFGVSKAERQDMMCATPLRLINER